MTNEPQPQLNPINIEHRLTLFESALFGVKEQLGNMVTQMQIANARTRTNEEAIRDEGDYRRNELMAVHEKVDAVSDGITHRAAMEAAVTQSFAAGQNSITVKLPWRQFLLGVSITATAMVAVETAARFWL